MTFYECVKFDLQAVGLAGLRCQQMAKNTRKFQFVLGRTGFIAFILGMAALVVVFFLLGIKMGAYLDTYPEKLASLPFEVVRYLGLDEESRQASKEQAALLAEKRQPPLQEADRKQEPGQQTAESTGAPVNTGENTTGNLLQKQVVQPPAETINSPTNPPVVRGSEVAMPVPAMNLEAAKPKVEPAVNYLIQVVAFREMEKARRYSEEINRIGYKSEVESFEQADSGAWFRVVIRNFETAEAARKVASRLNERLKGVNCVVRTSDPLNN